jgi:GNAT superfamily N-acetyltransferase
LKIKAIPIIEAHHSFVLANWLAQYRKNQFPPYPPAQEYFKCHQELAKKHLEGFMAVNSEDEDQYLGFIVSKENVIHFIYVKEVFRKLGIGKLLWETAGKPKVYTHNIKHTKNLIDRSFVYNPYLF